MRTTITSVVAALFLLPVLAGVRAAQEKGTRPAADGDAEKRHRILAPVMAKKLRYTHQLMTSLTSEDFARMAIDAGELKRIGETTLMKILPDQDYIKYANEFSSIVEELEHRARSHDLNGVTLSYIRLTMNCVECHKYVRDKSGFGRNR